ncbi:hypothetical protein [Massilia niastensis]|uniref:hypothetical protein n=1 Tax=Massilia niastensis TaxID=544911 RepID=UPI00036DFB42|nr:hypothetical protein [Massilia niastensis]
MIILKYVLGAGLLLGASVAGILLSESSPSPAQPVVQWGNGHPPTVDMSRFQHAFRH